MNYSAMLNKSLAVLTDIPTQEGRDLIVAFLKLVARFGPGSSTPVRDVGLYLSRPEEKQVLRLLTGGARFVVKWGSRFFLLGVVVDLGYRIITNSTERRTAAERFEIITAHVLKGSGPLATLFGVGEQLIFLASDAIGEYVPGWIDTFLAELDKPTSLPGPPGPRGAFHELLPVEGARPARGIVEPDVIIEAPGLLLVPELVDPSRPIGRPGPANPTWGRRH